MKLPDGIPEGEGETTEGSVSLWKVLALLPDLWCTRSIRDSLMAASHADLTTQWSSARMYQTFDSRILSLDVIADLVRESAAEESRRARTIIESLGRALQARAEDDREGMLVELLEEGEELMGDQRYPEAIAMLEIALNEIDDDVSAGLEARINKAFAFCCWQVGRFGDATEHYERALRIWVRSGDRASEIIAMLGLGNVRTTQGRWKSAESIYLQTLKICTSDDSLRRAQVYNNLSQVVRRQERLEEAAEWQSKAEDLLSDLDSMQDRVVAYNNAGLLHIARGDLDEARQALLDGLAIATSDLERSALLLNLAEAELKSANLDKAEAVAREAEEFGVLASATRLLIEIYTLLGTIFRMRGTDQAVGFYEKALELARRSPYHLERARAHVEYGRLRRAVGDDIEALAHFVEARRIFKDLNAETELMELLDEIG